MDRSARTDGLRFLLTFAAWATVAFLPAWWASHPWQRVIGAIAARAAAPPGTELDILDLELFYPMDLAVFVALCLASGWASWRRRGRALLIGAPIVVLAEVVALTLSMAALLRAGTSAASQAEATRLADALVRMTGLGVAAGVWFVALGRQRFAPIPAGRSR
jgi:hypothetical protein